MWLAFPLGEKIGIHITTQQSNVCIVLNFKNQVVSYIYKNYKTSLCVDIQLNKDYNETYSFVETRCLKGEYFHIILSFPNFHDCLYITQYQERKMFYISYNTALGNKKGENNY